MAAPTNSIEISAMVDGVAVQSTDSVPARRGAGNVFLTLAYVKTFVLNGLALAWGSITGTPTTLAGYGITDAASSAALTTEASTRAAADTALDTRVDALELAPTVISKLAGQIVGGHRAVWIDTDDAAYYADNSQVSADRVAGVTRGAALLAAAVAIQMQGEIIEPSWTWVPGPVFLGATGNLTQVAPVAGRVTQVGVATAPTKLLVRPEPAIVLV